MSKDNLKPLHLAFTVNYRARKSIIETKCTLTNSFNTSLKLRIKKTIWDTGATSTVIHKDIAQELKLTPIGKIESVEPCIWS